MGETNNEVEEAARPPDGTAWPAFVEAARVMCRIAATGLCVVQRDAIPPWVEVVHGVGLLAQPELARAGIIQAVEALGEGSGEASVSGRWRAIGWDAARALVVEAGPAGEEIAAWATREAERYRDLERAEIALDALGEGLVVVDGTQRVALCTRRAAELIGAGEPDAVESHRAEEVMPRAVRRLEPNEVARGALGSQRDITYIAQALAPRVGDTRPRPGMVLRLRGQERFVATRRGQLQLLSVLRHDVRSPLTALRGLVGVLQEEPDMPPGERQGLLELLRQEAERTVTWVEDYLVLLRLRFDPRPHNPVHIRCETPLRAIESQYAQHARERGVVFSIQADPRAAASRIEVDEALLEPFCKNLVGHFLRMADSGASVSVELQGDGALVVTGQGPGLFSQHPENPFTTLARSTAAGKRTPGVGLGLFLAKKVADAHGWPIEVTVQDGVVRAEVRWAQGSERETGAAQAR